MRHAEGPADDAESATRSDEQGASPALTGEAPVVGNRLRTARRRQRATLKDVSEKAGVSESFLSQIERGRTHGSIGSLTRITAALGMSMGELFNHDPSANVSVLRHADRPSLSFGESATKFVLTDLSVENFAVFVGVVEPGGSTGAEPFTHGDSEELVCVLRGRAVLEIGAERFDLRAGDSLFYFSSTPHRLHNPHDDVAEILWAISPPKS